MKKNIILLLVIILFNFLLLLVLPVKAEETLVKLQNNTRVKLAIIDNLSSERNLLGQEVSLQTVENLKVNNQTVIPAGTIAVGNITFLEKKGLCSKAGKLNIETLYMQTLDGTRIPLRGYYSVQGASKMAKMSALTIIFWCPIFLLMSGNPAEIPSGTKFNVYTDQDTMLKRIPSSL
ncbi:MAG: hypothetical protein V2B14_05320 [bacterium]